MLANIVKFSIVILLIGKRVQATPNDKWHDLGDIGTLFIESEHKYNWFQAWEECASRNMTLIAVDTAEKSAVVDALLRKKFEKCPDLWIGGHDNGEEGKFVWSSTGKRFEFSNWSGGNPDNYKNVENCVHYWSRTNFEWNDVPCTSKLGFICEENRFLLAARRDLEIKRNFILQLFNL